MKRTPPQPTPGEHPVIDLQSGVDFWEGPVTTEPGKAPNWQIVVGAPVAPGETNAAVPVPESGGATPVAPVEASGGDPSKLRRAAAAAGEIVKKVVEAAPGVAEALNRTGALDAADRWGHHRGGAAGTAARVATGAARFAAAAHRSSPTDAGSAATKPLLGITGGSSGTPPPAGRDVTSVPPGPKGRVYGVARSPQPLQPETLGPQAGSRQEGDVPRHLGTDRYLGLSEQQYDAILRQPRGRERLAERAAQLLAAQEQRIDFERGRYNPHNPRVYGDPMAGYETDPSHRRAPDDTPPLRVRERNTDDRTQYGHDLTLPERLSGVVRRVRQGLSREERRREDARNAGFDTMENVPGMTADEVNARHTKGYVAVDPASPPIVEVSPTEKNLDIPYNKLRFRN